MAQITSAMIPYSNENPFRLDSTFVMEEKERQGRAKWEEKGEVTLTVTSKIPKVVVEVEGSLAKEIGGIALLCNPVTTVVGAEKLTGLKNLNCRKSGFESVPRWIEMLPAIKTVWLNENNFNEIPSWLLEIPTLLQIYAQENKNLRQITMSDYSGKNLKSINMGDCDLQSLPNDFFHHGFEEVHLFGNKGESMRGNGRQMF